MDGWYGDHWKESVETLLFFVYYDRSFEDVYVYSCIYLKIMVRCVYMPSRRYPQRVLVFMGLIWIQRQFW